MLEISKEDNKIDKQYYWKALSPTVLVVAVVNITFQEWRVYVDNVLGANHDHEYLGVAEHGNQLSKKLAKILFPSLAPKYTWRF